MLSLAHIFRFASGKMEFTWSAVNILPGLSSQCLLYKLLWASVLPHILAQHISAEELLTLLNYRSLRQHWLMETKISGFESDYPNSFHQMAHCARW